MQHEEEHQDHQQIHHNQQIQQSRPEVTFSLKEIGAFALVIGGLVSSWINLNSSQVATNTKLEAFERYYRESLQEYKKTTLTSEMEIKKLIAEQKTMNKDLKDHVYDLERTVTELYGYATRKQKK